MTCYWPGVRIMTITLVAGAAILMASGCSESPTLLSPVASTISTIQVSASMSNLVVGDSVEVRATATAADGSPFALTAVGWTSSNTAIATVTATGPVTAVVRTIVAGPVSITATAESHSGQLALAVAARPVPPPTAVETLPWLAFIWSAETGMTALTFPPGVGRSYASAINDLGQVVGSVVIDQSSHAFVWTVEGGMTDIGGLPGSVWSYATAINNAGQVVGGSVDAAGRSQVFRWSPSEGMTALPMPPGTESSVVKGINAGGTVVGERNGSTGRILFRWSQERGMEDLTLFESDTYGEAIAIADNGDVVGYSGVNDWENDVTRAVIWSANGGKKIIDACTGGHFAWEWTYFCHSSANAINSAGQIVVAWEWGSSLAVISRDGLPQNIPGIKGSYWSSAAAINDVGQVVGSSQVGASSNLYPLEVAHGFLWSLAGGTVDLGALPGRHWSQALGINNRGQVVGSSY